MLPRTVLLREHLLIRILTLFRVESPNEPCGPHASLRMEIMVPESGTCLTCPVNTGGLLLLGVPRNEAALTTELN